MSNFRDVDRQTAFLLPPSVDEWLPERHLARSIVEVYRSSVAFHVQSQSVDIGSQSFDDYLRSAAFLDTTQFPAIDFASKSVEKVDDHTVRVTGDLTLLGVTRPLTVEVAVQRETAGSGQRFAFLAKTSIDRVAFGMNSGFPLVSREVELAISSEAVEL